MFDLRSHLPRLGLVLIVLTVGALMFAACDGGSNAQKSPWSADQEAIFTKNFRGQNNESDADSRRIKCLLRVAERLYPHYNDWVTDQGNQFNEGRSLDRQQIAFMDAKSGCPN